MQQYVQDYDERFPPRYQSFSDADHINNPPGGAWFPANPTTSVLYFVQQILYPYHKSVGIMVCPDAVKGQNPDSSVGTKADGSVPTLEEGPYLGNYGFAQGIFGANPLPRLAKIQDPAQTFMSMDAGTYDIGPAQVSTYKGAGYYLPGSGEAGAAAGSPALPSVFYNDMMSGRHFGGINICYVDGHVKWLSLKTVKGLGNPSKLPPWNVP